MNIQVVHEVTDITNHVISYRREHNVCEGIGSLTFEVPLSDGLTFDTWDYIELTEDGNLKGKYFIHTITDNIPSNVLTIDCQDRSKRLTDYFVDTIYTIGNYDFTKEWIIAMLEEAGVNSYDFTDVGNGTRMTPEMTLGLDSAYNIIQTLLQQSGWYMYFDNTGKAIIGKLERGGSVKETLNGDDILSLSRSLNDAPARNRAVVWGHYNSGFGTWVTAEATKRTGWQIDEGDVRTVLVSSSYINDYYTAGKLASTLLNEFSTLADEKTIEVHGARDLELADKVYVDNTVYKGTGFITSISSEMSRNGLITTVVLDERCPRLFGYFSDGSDYVYVSSDQQGVWRKPLNSDTWENFSTGLDDLNIIDLYVRNGNFVCVGASGYAFTRTEVSNSWSKIYPGTVTYSGDTYPESSIRAVACAINANNQTKVGYTAISGSRSWLYTDGFIENIVTTLNSEITILDIDSQNDDIVVGQGSGYIEYSWNGGDPFPAIANTQNLEHFIQAGTHNPPNVVALPFTTVSGLLYYGTDFTNDYVLTGDKQRMLINSDGEQEWWGLIFGNLRKAVPADNYLSSFDYTDYNYTGATPIAFYVDFSTDTAYTLSASLSDPASISGTVSVINLNNNTHTSTTLSGSNMWSGLNIHWSLGTHPYYNAQSGSYFYFPVLIDDPSYGWAVGYYKINIKTGNYTCHEFDRIPIGTVDFGDLRISGGRAESGGDYALFYGKSIIWDASSNCTRSFHYRSQYYSSVNTYFNKATTWPNRVYITEWYPTNQSGRLIGTQPSCYMTSRRHYDPTLDGGRLQYVACILQPDKSISVIDFTSGYIPTGYYTFSMYNTDSTYWFSEHNLLPTATKTPLLVFAFRDLVAGTDQMSSGVTTIFNLRTFSAETLAPVTSASSDFTSFNPDNYTDDFIALATSDFMNNRYIMTQESHLRPFTVDMDSGSVFNMYIGGFGNVGNLNGEMVSYVGNSFMYPASNSWNGVTVVWTSAPPLYYTYYQTANKVLKKIGDNLFTNIYNGPVNKVEMSKPTPTVVYNELQPNDGVPSFINSHTSLSWTNASGSFTAVPGNRPVYDLRTYDMGTYNPDATFSGFQTFIGIATIDSFSRIPVTASGADGWTIEYFNNPYVSRIETSNFNERPYLFANTPNGVSVSGVSVSGYFQQQNANTTVWLDRSVAFPSGNITSIRVDDRI